MCRVETGNQLPAYVSMPSFSSLPRKVGHFRIGDVDGAHLSVSHFDGHTAEV